MATSNRLTNSSSPKLSHEGSESDSSTLGASTIVFGGCFDSSIAVSNSLSSKNYFHFGIGASDFAMDSDESLSPLVMAFISGITALEEVVFAFFLVVDRAVVVFSRSFISSAIIALETFFFVFFLSSGCGKSSSSVSSWRLAAD